MTRPKSPASMEEFQLRLVEVSGSLPKRLKQCADYVALNTDRIAISTVAELSAAAGVQPSAFMRFCQLMGFSGYSQMQRMFRDYQTRGWPDYSTRLESLRASGDDTPAALLAEFVEAGRRSLENLANSVDAEALDEAVELLSKASMIHVVGLNRAFPVATYLAYAFEKMDIPAILHDRIGNLDRRHAIRPEDVLIAISFAPYSSQTLDLAAYCRSGGGRVIAITDALNSPLHWSSATILMVSEIDVGAFRALSATLTLATALSVAVGTKRKAQPE
jgi:DNA-binding MurR/RpiR family transcriptional regulator